MSEMQLRQFDILQPSALNITIVGAGGIGSWTALSLAKMGYENITVYDFDKVEEHNIGTQFYKTEDIGRDKVHALMENILGFTGTEICFVADKATEPITADVLILAVDNMKARKEISEQAQCQFMIDARMGGQIFNIFSVMPYEMERYKETLFADEDGVQEPCTAKAIAYNVFGIASFISNLVKRFDKGERMPFELNGDYINLKLYNTKF